MLKSYNCKISNSKIKSLEKSFSLNFYKILNKKCSIKRLSHFDIVDRNLIFQKCNILVENDFIVIQGKQSYFFSSIISNFIITKTPQNFVNTFLSWEIVKPINVELNANKTEIKIVFRPSKSIGNSNYSLIISNLEKNEFQRIEKIKNYYLA